MYVRTAKEQKNSEYVGRVCSKLESKNAPFLAMGSGTILGKWWFYSWFHSNLVSNMTEGVLGDLKPTGSIGTRKPCFVRFQQKLLAKGHFCLLLRRLQGFETHKGKRPKPKMLTTINSPNIQGQDNGDEIYATDSMGAVESALLHKSSIGKSFMRPLVSGVIYRL